MKINSFFKFFHLCINVARKISKILGPLKNPGPLPPLNAPGCYSCLLLKLRRVCFWH